MKKANPALVGAFVIGGIALAVGLVVAFGGGRFFADTERYVLFFDGSVTGLTRGSAVKLRGVEIGEVLEVSAIVGDAPRLEDPETEIEVLTEVIIQIDRSRFKRYGRVIPREQRSQVLSEAGLRGRLELQSIVTGQLYVGFDFHPETEARLAGASDEYPELPTIPSLTQEISSTIRALVARIQKMPLEDIMDNLNEAIAAIRDLARSPDLANAITHLDEALVSARSTLDSTRGTVVDARKLINNVDGKVEPVADSAVGALDQARTTLASVDTAVHPESDVRYELSVALEELAEAARAIRLLADFVERNPNALVFGRRGGGGS